MDLKFFILNLIIGLILNGVFTYIIHSIGAKYDYKKNKEELIIFIIISIIIICVCSLMVNFFESRINKLLFTSILFRALFISITVMFIRVLQIVVLALLFDNKAKSIVSSDMHFAEKFKDKIKDKDLKANYIKTMNYTNLISSTILGVIVYIFVSLDCEDSIIIIISLVLGRAISRSFQIIFAFTEDVIDIKGDKSTSLNSKDRLKLAIKSFFEIIINYATVYYAINSLFISLEENLTIPILDSSNIFASIYKSIGISTLTNVGDLTFISTIQVLSTMSLIYFGLAGYINGER